MLNGVFGHAIINNDLSTIDAENGLIPKLGRLLCDRCAQFSARLKLHTEPVLVHPHQASPRGRVLARGYRKCLKSRKVLLTKPAGGGEATHAEHSTSKKGFSHGCIVVQVDGQRNEFSSSTLKRSDSNGGITDHAVDKIGGGDVGGNMEQARRVGRDDLGDSRRLCEGQYIGY
jgi:hypothetical protein